MTFPPNPVRSTLAPAAARSIVLACTVLVALGACGAPADTRTSTPSAPPAADSGASTGTTGAPGGASGPGAAGSTTVTTASSSPDTGAPAGTTVAPGASAASCRTVDLGGLTVSVACDADVPEPESGVTLTPDSVYGLPGASFDELAEVDATNRVVTTPDGRPVTIYLLGSDTLFDVGSSTVKSTAEVALPDVIASIEQRSPNGKVLVRGFTDSSGSASGNQTLSEARAAAMVAWLGTHGLSPSRMEASGYGSTRPAAAETGELGPALNRRIEIVVIG